MSTPGQDVATHQHTNRLIDETSPYLLQHAHNPVDWYPWSEEAIQKAREENKLIFLSIGYSTCYWCHVMERESFENEEIARMMNERFVNIKVDREERPDVDDLYMMAVQLITGRGGWPMSVWLEPDELRPVYAGTYFPAEPKHNMPSFPQVIEAIDRAWREQRDEMLQNAERVAEAIGGEMSKRGRAVPLSETDVNDAVNRLMSIYDAEDGGFGDAPKFPQPSFIELLLACRPALEDESLQMVDGAIRLTLDRMAMGGMYDQVGGGFHRYSTDEKWLVPHFEKMLYDNAQLASIYARASNIYDDPWYAEVARETLDYAIREMRHDDGGFFSAQDAEVNHREGQNYLWTADSVRDTLQDAGLGEHVDLALAVYGLDQGTNFQDPHHPDEPRANVLYLVDRPDVLARRFDLPAETFNERLREINRALLAERATRDQPGTDDKVITAWNGLMIAALADAARALQEPAYLDAAKKAARFILSEMRDDDGTLRRTWREGQPGPEAVFEDYAMLIHGLIELERAAQTEEWRHVAIDLARIARELYWDPVNGASFDTRADQTDLFVRMKSTFDGAMPSGNSVMLHNLLDLHELTQETSYLDDAEDALEGLSSAVKSNPLGAALASTAVLRFIRSYPDRLPEADERLQATDAGAAVLVSADRDVIRVSEDGSDTLALRFDIAEGYHVNAHEPGDDQLVGLLVSVVGGEGVVATAGYPEGELYGVERPSDPGIRIHTGSFTIPVRFEKVGEITGEPKLHVRWQTCTETECLPPTEKTLDIRIEPVE